MDLLRLPKFTSKASFDRFIDAHYDRSLEAFYQALNKLSDHLIRTDLKKSGRLTDQIAALERYLPPPYRAHLYRIRGRHYHLASRYLRAHKLYNRAIALFEKLKDRNNRARVQKALLDVLMYLGRYDEGLRVGRQSLAYFRRAGAEIDYAQVSTNLGNLFHRLDQNKKALAHYDRAYEIFKRTENEYAEALVQFNSANAHANLNNLDLAKKLYRRAGEQYRALGMELAACQADYSLAYLAFLEGYYSRSLAAFAEVAECFRRLGDQRCLALTELDLTEVNLHLNLYSQAIHDVQNVAGRFDRLGMAYEQAKAYYFAAVGYFAYGDFGRVMQLAGRAEKMFAREQNQVWEIQCRFLKARVDCQEKRFTGGLKALRAIAAFYRRQGDIRRYHDVRLAWLEALIASGNGRGAAVLIRGIDKARRELAGYQRFIFFRLIGDHYRQKSQGKSAAAYYRRAITEAQKLQATISPDEILRFFWIDKLALYTRLAAIYLKTGQKRKAFEIIESGRTETVPVSSRVVGAKSDWKIPPALVEERRKLRAYLRRAMTPTGSAARAVAPADRVKSAEQKLWKIERQVRRKGRRDRQLAAGRFYPLAEIQKRPAGNETIIHYVCRDEILGAFIIGRDRFEFIRLGSDIDDIRGLLARLYFLVSRVSGGDADRRIITDLLAAISERVWQPIAEKLAGIKKLALVPDGILSRLPFYALDNGDRSRLYEKYASYFLPSSSNFTGGGSAGNLSGRFSRASVLVAANGDLPGGREEGIAVSSRLPGSRLLTGDRADRAGLLDSLRDRGGLVHLVAHAAQSYENHLFSPIVLSDGPVYPFDLLAHQVNSRLVVLSGCQTGDPGLFFGENSVSLAHSFIAAGARSVIASYWPVADEPTGRFMDSFYENLTAGKNVYQSLRSAMDGVRAVSEDIRHWASFYLLRR